MSKGSLYWEQASGKLGATVLYRSGGEQRARAYVAKIKNPKTLAQMQNRILMNNVVSMFRGLKPILSNSFPTRATKQSGFNAFVSANKNINPYAVSKTDLENSAFIPLGLRIAKGDIAISTSLGFGMVTVLEGSEIFDNGVAFTMGGLNGTPVTVEGYADRDALTMKELTGKDIYNFLTANGNPNGYPSEFKVTIVGSYYGIGAPKGGNDAWYAAYRIYTCNATNEDTGQAFGDESNTSSLKVMYGDAVKSDTGTNAWAVTSLTATKPNSSEDEAMEMCVGVIVSWTENGKLRVTNSTIQGSDAVAELCKDWQKGGEVYEQVLSQYGYTEGDALATV